MVFHQLIEQLMSNPLDARKCFRGRQNRRKRKKPTFLLCSISILMWVDDGRSHCGQNEESERVAEGGGRKKKKSGFWSVCI